MKMVTLTDGGPYPAAEKVQLSAAAGCARRPALTWPPVDDDRAWFPGMTEAAVLREAGMSSVLAAP